MGIEMAIKSNVLRVTALVIMLCFVGWKVYAYEDHNKRVYVESCQALNGIVDYTSFHCINSRGAVHG
jgi:hypothetical protein